MMKKSRKKRKPQTMRLKVGQDNAIKSFRLKHKKKERKRKKARGRTKAGDRKKEEERGRKDE